MALALYAHPLSSFSQKAKIALYELDLPFEAKMLGPEAPENGAELARIWPFCRFPVLVDGERVIPEATLVIEYLDARAGGGRLLPDDPAARLEARLLDRVFDNYVAVPQQKIVTDRLRPEGRGDPHGVEEARKQLETSYAWLEQRLAGRAWAAGEAFSLADCAAAPFLFYADWVQPIGDRLPILSAYLRRLRERPSVRRAVDEGRPYRHLVPGGIPAHID